MVHPDVIVVGSGPAGVVCAITIASAGYTVTLVDRKKKEIIGKKTCGDAIDMAALYRLEEGTGISPPSGEEVSDEIKIMSIAVDTIDEKISLDAPGVIVDRHIFGQRLLDHALREGVTLIDQATVREVIVEENHVVGIRYLKKGIHEIRAKLVVDASGAYAVIRRGLPDSMIVGGMKRDLNNEEQWPSYREIIELQEDHDYMNEIILKYDENYPPPGYFWIFSKGKKKLNVGIGWEKSQDFGPMKSAYLAEMEQYYPRDSYKVLQQGGGQIPFRIPFDNLVFNGGALVGDAACMVHPITAEGHGPALDTAWRLGKVIMDALERERYDMDTLWRYNSEIASHYGRKHAEAEVFRKFIEGIGVKGMRNLFTSGIFSEEELNLVFSGGSLRLSKKDLLTRIMKFLRYPTLLFRLQRVFMRLRFSKKHYAKYPNRLEGLASWRAKRNKKLGMNY